MCVVGASIRCVQFPHWERAHPDYHFVAPTARNECAQGVIRAHFRAYRLSFLFVILWRAVHRCSDTREATERHANSSGKGSSEGGALS